MILGFKFVDLVVRFAGIGAFSVIEKNGLSLQTLPKRTKLFIFALAGRR